MQVRIDSIGSLNSMVPVIWTQVGQFQNKLIFSWRQHMYLYKNVSSYKNKVGIEIQQRPIHLTAYQFTFVTVKTTKTTVQTNLLQ